MKALNLVEYNRFEYVEVPRPEPGPGEVLVRIRACGICGSDIHGMDGSSGRRIPPLIMGHEAAGVIEETGEGVSGWRPGDRVTFDSTVYCGDCEYCRRGLVNLCEDRRVLGVSCGEYRQQGAFAEYLKIPARILHRVPDELPLETAAFAEPVSIALHAVSLLPVKEGDTAVVVGAGLIGLLVIQALRLAGAGRVLAVDLDAGRRRLAEQLGAERSLDAADDQLLKKLAALTGDTGADLSVEVVGISPTLAVAIHCLRKGGSACLVGNLSATTEFPMQTVVTREITLYGSCGSAGDYPEAIEHLAAGAIKVAPLVSGEAALADGADWFRRLYDNKEGLMKVILKP